MIATEHANHPHKGFIISSFHPFTTQDYPEAKKDFKIRFERRKFHSN